jgi:hypothetical protein
MCHISARTAKFKAPAGRLGPVNVSLTRLARQAKGRFYFVLSLLIYLIATWALSQYMLRKFCVNVSLTTFNIFSS